jgi:uncharacterized protein
MTFRDSTSRPGVKPLSDLFRKAQIMARKVFLNLPVRDLGKSRQFFTALGFEFNAQFSDDRAACMVLSDDGYVMLLDERFFATFTDKTIADPATTTEVIVALSADSRGDVDRLVNAALANGGAPGKEPVSDGPMYGWSFQDVDRHQWEVIYMDPAALES